MPKKVPRKTIAKTIPNTHLDSSARLPEAPSEDEAHSQSGL